MGRMKQVLAVFLLSCLFLLPFRSADAGDSLDVKDWLSRPGVKLLAVEFYASWCGPCKEAVPKWKVLHERYREQGLRLIVVSVQDPDGSCVNPGWNPDDVICDMDGHVSNAMGVGQKLPAAFLWSWRGNLIVRKGHFDEVERAVKGELSRLPRVALDLAIVPDVREQLRVELGRTGKVDVVSGKGEDDALAAIRKESHDPRFSRESACTLGAQLAANSLVQVRMVKVGQGQKLLVQVFNAESGCLSASAGVFWNERRPEISVGEAVAELINNMKVPLENPAESENLPSGTLNKRQDNPSPNHSFLIGVSLTEGAVIVDGDSARTNLMGHLSAWLPFGKFRCEMTAGKAVDGQGFSLARTGAVLDLGVFFVKGMFSVAIGDGKSYWGVLGGAGYAFRLAPDWFLDAEVDTSVWPGKVLGIIPECRLGLRYGF